MKPGDFGVSIFYGHKPMKKLCDNCPFAMADKGMDYLAPGRLDGIKFAVSLGQAFPCHKTVHNKNVEYEVDEEGFEQPPSYDRNYRQCAGAIAYAENLKAELEKNDVD
ncbi:MAG: hypothetical protein ACEQSB_00670 [Undibacterium sp.]